MTVKFFRTWRQLVYPQHLFEFHVCPLSTRVFYVYIFKEWGITIKLAGWQWRRFEEIW